MFFLLKFPIHILSLCQFSILSNIPYNIFIHTHSISITTIKITNFLPIMLNYKLKLYKTINNKSSRYISLIQKSNNKKRNQKGLGASRVGSLKSSISRGGGVIFGPHPRLYSLKINIKEWVCVYKSFLINKRHNILWYFINPILKYYKKEVFLKNLESHLGINAEEGIMYSTISKHFLYKKFTDKVWFYHINLLNFLNSKYIIYLI